MGSTIDLPGFFKLVMREAGTIPPRGLIYLGMAGLVSGIADLIVWGNASLHPSVDVGINSVVVVVWTLAIYTTSVVMIGYRASFSGLWKFFVTSLLVITPFLMALALLLVGVKSEIVGLTFSALALIIAGMGFGALLPGWPLLQATSRNLVGPLTALRVTRGSAGP